MKNLFIALALFFAVGATAQAQKTQTKTVVAPVKMTPEMAAQKNIADLVAFTPLNAQTQASLLELFTTKYKLLTENGELSSERKAGVYQSIDLKMQSILDVNTYQKVKANTKLYDSLIK
jgi:hypothetical protein